MTRYEEEMMYAIIRGAKTLERIADSLEQIADALSKEKEHDTDKETETKAYVQEELKKRFVLR